MKDKLTRYINKISRELNLTQSQRPEIIIEDMDDYAGYVHFEDGRFIVQLSPNQSWVEIQATINHEFGHIKSNPEVYQNWNENTEKEYTLLKNAALRELNARLYEDKLSHRKITIDTLFQWYTQICREFFNTPHSGTYSYQNVIGYCSYLAHIKRVSPKTIKIASRLAKDYFKNKRSKQ
jgi:hypothetical protein